QSANLETSIRPDLSAIATSIRLPWRFNHRKNLNLCRPWRDCFLINVLQDYDTRQGGRSPGFDFQSGYIAVNDIKRYWIRAQISLTKCSSEDCIMPGHYILQLDFSVLVGTSGARCAHRGIAVCAFEADRDIGNGLARFTINNSSRDFER